MLQSALSLAVVLVWLGPSKDSLSSGLQGEKLVYRNPSWRVLQAIDMCPGSKLPSQRSSIRC